jgi:hypothetical protein
VRETVPKPAEQFRGESVVRVGRIERRDGGRNALTHHGVGHAEHRRVEDLRMADEQILGLLGRASAEERVNAATALRIGLFLRGRTEGRDMDSRGVIAESIAVGTRDNSGDQSRDMGILGHDAFHRTAERLGLQPHLEPAAGGAPGQTATQRPSLLPVIP